MQMPLPMSRQRWSYCMSVTVGGWLNLWVFLSVKKYSCAVTSDSMLCNRWNRGGQMISYMYARLPIKQVPITVGRYTQFGYELVGLTWFNPLLSMSFHSSYSYSPCQNFAIERSRFLSAKFSLYFFFLAFGCLGNHFERFNRKDDRCWPVMWTFFTEIFMNARWLLWSFFFG